MFSFDILSAAANGEYKWMPAGIQKITTIEIAIIAEGDGYRKAAHVLLTARNGQGKAESSFGVNQMPKLGTVLAQIENNKDILAWLKTNLNNPGASELFKTNDDMMIFSALKASKDALGREYFAANLTHMDEDKADNKAKINEEIGLV